MVPTPGEPWDMAGADFNSDGHHDLVVSGRDTDYLLVLLGRGDGCFLPETVTTYSPHGVDVGDFNEDGKPDLVTTFHDDAFVSVFMGNGDGTFSYRALYASGEEALYIRVADVNEDEHDDLVVIDWGSHFMILLGDGEGSFALHGTYDTNSYGRPDFGDLDEDGHLDLAIPRSGGDVDLFWGQGDGTFTHHYTDKVDTGDQLWSVEVVDLDGDGHQDVITPNYGSDDLSVVLGNGDGTFAPETRYPITVVSNGNPWRVAVVDLNHDGDLDLAVGNQWDGHVSVFLGHGDGSLGPETAVPTPYNGGSIVAGDFDEDGNQDLSVASWQKDALFTLYGLGDGTFVPLGSRFFEVEGIPTGMVQGDFDEDGIEDLATSNRSSDDATILLGDGRGGFAEPHSLAAGTTPNAIAAGDLNDDDHFDLVVANIDSDDASVFLGLGDGHFAAEIRVPLGTRPGSIAVGELNGDNYDDLAFVGVTPVDAVSVLIGNGDGTFTAGTSSLVGTEPSSVAIADLDQDSAQDLIVTNRRSHDVSILLGTGGGSFDPEVRYATGEFPRSVTVGDLERDGVPDLAVAIGSRFEALTLLRGGGDGTFVPLASPPTLVWGTRVAIDDLNGDGRPDLVMAGLGVALGAGDGTFGPAEYYATSGNGGGVATGDFDGDGWTDVAETVRRGVVVMLNRSPAALNFSPDKVCLGWPAMREATSYNVYRGPLSDLADGDADGLPDTGYGTCQNHRDLDTTDNHFVETNVPPPGDGFFYLHAVVDSAGEQGLGTTSAGLPRFPAETCPAP